MTNEISYSGSFKGYLLAAYKLIASTVRAVKIIRVMIVSSLLILVVLPSILILIAFLFFPSQTTIFFNFQVKTAAVSSENSDPRVLAAATANPSFGNVISSYISAIYKPQAEAAVQSLRVINSPAVANVVLPTEQLAATQPVTIMTTETAGVQGLQGLQGIQGNIGPSGPKGDTGLGITEQTIGFSFTGGTTPKTLTIRNTLTFDGTDSTTFTLPGSSDTLVGLSVGATLTNKTISAGSNTITGLTNSNLSGTAGITDANLATISTANKVSGSAIQLNANSGLINNTGLSLLTTCSSGEVLKWNGSAWACAAGITTLQTAYDSGNTITTTTGRNISFALADVATDTSFTITQAGVVTGLVINDTNIGTNTGLDIQSGGTSKLAINELGDLTSSAASTWTLANTTNSLNFDINTLSLDALNNRVGIGTSTPDYGLSIVGNVSTSNIASISNFNTTDISTNSVLRLTTGTAAGSATNTRFIQFFGGVTAEGSTGTGVGTIKLQNSGVQYVSGNADLAEWTEVVGSPVAGDIIASKASGNQKAVTADLVLGVVSDTAAFVGNETVDLTGKAIVGMLGRVNTRVSNENGNIAIGDPIAPSSVAGVGMKQTKAGPTIGKALAVKTGARVERIAVQVVPGWYDPDPLLTPGSFSISGTNVLDFNSAVVTRVGGFQNIFAGRLTLADGLTDANLATISTANKVSGSAIQLNANSGLINNTGLSLLTTCSSGEVLKWNGSAWACAADSPGESPLLNTIAAAVGANSINNDNNAQVWNWGLTTATKTAFTFSESTPATNGAGSQYILGISTTGSSTAAPLKVSVRGNTIIDTTSTGGLTFGNVTINTPITLYSGTGAINIGTDSFAKTINFGNTTSTTALFINAGTGNINFNIGSTAVSGKVMIGNSGSVTPDILVLDNGTADPTGVNGATYYNTSLNKFRCYENSTWKNCVTNPGSNMQHAVTYATNDTNFTIGTGTSTVATVSVTPATATGDVYVRASITIVSGDNNDQVLTLNLRNGNCSTGTTITPTNVIIVASKNAIVAGAYEMSGIVINPGTSALTFSLCASATGNVTNLRLNEMIADVIDTGADLAEVYTTSDASISAGDVVSLDSNLKTGIKKSQVAYDKSIFGIVATRPGLIIGNVDNEGSNAVLVALSGRVPVKVNTQNGPISAGDYLTSSPVDGVAMKATRAGSIIGTAMTSFDGDGVGEILVFVKNSVSLGNNLDTGTTMVAVTPDLVAKTFSDLIKNITEFFANIIHTKTLCIGEENNETCITKEKLDQILQKINTDVAIPTLVPTVIPEVLKSEPSITPGEILTISPGSH